MDDIWSGVQSAPAPASSGSALGDFFNNLLGSASKRIDQELLKDQTGQTFSGSSTTPTYGVNEYGQPYYAGKATFLSGQIAGLPAPLVIAGVAVLAFALLHGKL